MTDVPGFKECETSREAALSMQGVATQLRRDVLAYILANPLYTADDIAAAMGKTPWNIRPRVSELRKAGLVVNDGRGVSVNGNAAHRWRVA